jgi:hypothetical protein
MHPSAAAAGLPGSRLICCQWWRAERAQSLHPCVSACSRKGPSCRVAVMSTIEGLTDLSGNLLPIGCLPVPYPTNPGPAVNERNLSYRIGAVGIVGSARDICGALA